MGPLSGVRVVEFAGLAPAPFACMVLADLGAEVVSIERRNTNGSPLRARPFEGPVDVLGRGRSILALDLKSREGRDTALRLVERADLLVEGFRPGVMERLGLGPGVCLDRNSGLIYGRMTGWGQDGPLSQTAGHDINYISVAGALHPLGRAGEAPVPPANLIGDFGGGGMLLVVGILAALLERQRSGLGQVVDAAMVDGAALLTAFLHGLRASGLWSDTRGTNLIDTGSPFYEVYETADGEYMGVGAIEPEFYDAFVRNLGLDPANLSDRADPASWPLLREEIAAGFRLRTRREWTDIFEGTDSCVSPVLALGEVASHSHNRYRKTFIDVDGVLQPSPAPRFSRTPPRTPEPASQVDSVDSLLAAWEGTPTTTRLS